MSSTKKTFADFNINLPPSGGVERYTTCPQCSPSRKRGSQKKPCLSVNTEKEVWICHHCGWTGSLKGGVDNRKKELHWNQPEYRRPEYDAYKGISAQAVDWFKTRGIPEQVLTRNNITTGSIYMPQVEDFVNAIQFPAYRDGQCINIKYRDHQKNFRMEARAERIFYGLDDVSELTVIVEGELDKLTCETAGITACISVPDGAPDPKTKDYSSKFDFLENSKEQLTQVKHFVLAVDSDEAGKRLESELLHRLGQDRCLLSKWPDDCKDANEVLLKHGSIKLLDCIYNAEPPPTPGIIHVHDIADRLEYFYDNGMAPGVNPGWKGLADFYNVSPGEWTLVTGIPGHGKSEFLDALLVNLANLHDWPFAIYSPENFPLEQHIAKILEKKSGKPFRGHSDWVRMSKEEMKQTSLWIDRYFHFIKPQEDNLTLTNVLDLAKTLVFRSGIKGLVIDPWNELEPDRPQHMTETEYISLALAHIRQFSRNNNVHTWVVAHPTKMQKQGNGKYPVPTAYDVSGSAHFRNKADNALSIYRPDPTNQDGLVEIHIQKIRFKKNGRLGKCEMKYDPLSGRFVDVLQNL